MSSARDDVLARIRQATVGVGVVDVPRDYRRAEDGAADLALFIDRLEDYKAVVHRTTPSEVARVLQSLGLGRVVVPTGLPPEWTAGLDIIEDTALTPLELDGVDGVVTSCALAIAETGTIVLDAGPGQGRRALTLVPDRHVVIVHEEQVVTSVPDAVARLDATRSQTWISGPSATSDIELQRVEGVHGPRTLEFLIVTSPGGP